MKICLHKFLMAIALMCFFPLCLAAESKAEQPITIYSILLKERLSSEGGLGYNKLEDFFLQDVKDSTKVKYVPLPRGSRALVEDTSSCLYPVSPWAWKARGNRDHFDIISSIPMDVVSGRVYTKKDAPLITNEEQLSGKKVGHLTGQIALKILKSPEEINLLAANSDESLLKLISRDRIDAVLGFHPDTIIAMNRLDYQDLHYAPDYALFEVSIHLTCHNTPQTRLLMNKVNNRIIEAHKTGKIVDFLGSEAQIVPLDPTEATKIW